MLPKIKSNATYWCNVAERRSNKMLGFLTAISVAAAGVAKHLMDVNKAEKEKKEKDEEIQRLKEELEAEQMRKRQLQAEQDLQRFRKTMAETNTLEYIKGVGRIVDMRERVARIEADMHEDDSDYEDRRRRCEHLKTILDENERMNELNFGENKPRNMTKEDMYLYYLKYFKEEDEGRYQNANDEVAATEEMKNIDEELIKHIKQLKIELADMEKNLVNDGSEKYEHDLQTIKDTKEKISLLERRLNDNQYRK